MLLIPWKIPWDVPIKSVGFKNLLTLFRYSQTQRYMYIVGPCWSYIPWYRIIPPWHGWFCKSPPCSASTESLSHIIVLVLSLIISNIIWAVLKNHVGWLLSGLYYPICMCIYIYIMYVLVYIIIYNIYIYILCMYWYIYNILYYIHWGLLQSIPWNPISSQHIPMTSPNRSTRSSPGWGRRGGTTRGEEIDVFENGVTLWWTNTAMENGYL